MSINPDRSQARWSRRILSQLGMYYSILAIQIQEFECFILCTTIEKRPSTLLLRGFGGKSRHECILANNALQPWNDVISWRDHDGAECHSPRS
jgi:hypothetical protein